MGYAKIRFVPLSPFSRLFTADQLWGQMVWAISEMKGEKEAGDFVKAFETNPPFLISAMIPEGFFPMPVLPPIDRVRNTSKSAERQARQEAKKNKRLEWISVEDYSELQNDLSFLSSHDLMEAPAIDDTQETHVSISRLNLCAIDKGLYNISYKTTTSGLVCYLIIDKDDSKLLTQIKEIIKYWEQINLGGDRSTGRGAFKISLESLTPLEKQILEKKANCFMTLSRCFGDDLLPMRYKLSAYAGIIGRGIDENIEARFYNKQPVIGFEPGSIFSNGKGCLAHNVNTDSRVCSYGYAFPVPLNL